jgi:hypothetical protein
MNASQPPKVALALLRAAAADDEPLAGDLLEEFHAGRSRRWFWRQVLRAVVTAGVRRRRRVSPILGLNQSPMVRPDMRLPLLDPATINLSGIKVRGIGGLGLIAIVGLVTVVMPAAWLLLVIGLVGGVVLGAIKVVRRRRDGLSGPGDGGPVTLFGNGEEPQPRPAMSAASSSGVRPPRSGLLQLLGEAGVRS